MQNIGKKILSQICGNLWTNSQMEDRRTDTILQDPFALHESKERQIFSNIFSFVGWPNKGNSTKTYEKQNHQRPCPQIMLSFHKLHTKALAKQHSYFSSVKSVVESVLHLPINSSSWSGSSSKNLKRKLHGNIYL